MLSGLPSLSMYVMLIEKGYTIASTKENGHEELTSTCAPLRLLPGWSNSKEKNMNMDTLYYAGIGSRATPQHVLNDMTNISRNLEQSGFVLRSGGAAGADSAFEAGIQMVENAEIYLPWCGFNKSLSGLYPPTPDALKMAADYHPAWNRCTNAARAFHARNCHQILGRHLDDPVQFVLCWTPEGAVFGGTGQALRIAIAKDIPIFNMGGDDSWELKFNNLVEAILSTGADFGFKTGTLPAGRSV